MAIKKIIIYSISILFLMNCSNKNKKSTALVEKWYGKEIVFPNDSLLRNVTVHSHPLRKKLKIFVPVNGDCSMCIDELAKWKLFIEKDLDTSIVGLGFLIFTHDNLRTFTDLTNSLMIDFEYPFYQDNNMDCLIKNGFDYDGGDQPFLLDEDNKVIVLGNPIHNEAVGKLYVDEIRKRH